MIAEGLRRVANGLRQLVEVPSESSADASEGSSAPPAPSESTADACADDRMVPEPQRVEATGDPRTDEEGAGGTKG